MHYYCGGFFEPEEDAYAAEQLITVDNADVLLVLQDAFDHIAVAQRYNVPVFGVDAPQNSIAPDIIVTSTYWVWGPMLIRYIDSINSGSWQGGFTYWGFRENGVGISALGDFVDPSLTAITNIEVTRMIENELINGTSFVFCGSKWTSLAPLDKPACLNEQDITAMDYFISGVDDRGFITLPKSPENDSLARWKIAVIVVFSVLGLLLLIAAVLLLLKRQYHIFMISKKESDGEW